MQKKITAILFIFSTFIFLFVVLLAFFFLIQNLYAKYNKTSPLISIYTIVSPSMEPKIKIYDAVLIKKITNDSDIKENDIVAFYSDKIDTQGYTITHRIHSKYKIGDKYYYLTKGDNNMFIDDGIITKDNIVGKVILIIPGLGLIQTFISSSLGWTLLILLPAIIIISYNIYKLIKIKKIKDRIKRIDIKALDTKQNKKIIATIEESKKINK